MSTMRRGTFAIRNALTIIALTFLIAAALPDVAAVAAPWCAPASTEAIAFKAARPVVP